MDKEVFIGYITYHLHFNEKTNNILEFPEIAEQFYEDFVESYGFHFGEQPLVWNKDLAKRIVDEELAAMEYE